MVTNAVSTSARLGRRASAGVLLAFAWTGLAGAGPMPESFAGLAEKAIPSVVTVTGAKLSENRVTAQDNPPFDFPKGSPFGELFRQFRERQMPERESSGVSLGSGFIIDAAGYIVTNNHVIDGARDIQVKLADRRELRARVVGADAHTDLALLKVEAPDALPAVEFGDSDTIKIGDWVMAVGNPFGLGGTVTVGVLSARGRDIKSGPYDDFLQIDASINPGNSGGPTFATDGKVIGVNTAIFSPSGGNIGIGFAVPSNQAKQVIAELRVRGQVERGWLGVSIQPVTLEIARAVGLDRPAGALVAQIVANSPAAMADMRAGDIVLSFAGDKISDTRDLPRLVARAEPGSKAAVELWRDKTRHTIELQVAKLAPPDKVAADDNAAAGNGAAKYLGARLSALTPALRQQFSIKDGVTGVLVLAVESGDPRREALRPGDIIQTINGTSVTTPVEVGRLVAGDGRRGAVLVQVLRAGERLFLGVPVA